MRFYICYVNAKINIYDRGQKITENESVIGQENSLIFYTRFDRRFPRGWGVGRGRQLR
jgi:hypothetical protein